MRLRHVAAAVVLAAAAASPAHAGSGVGVDADYAGSITGSTALSTVAGERSASSGPAHVVNGHCSFAGVLTPDNSLTVTFGGAATSSGPIMPQLTYVRCEIDNSTESAHCEFAWFFAESQCGGVVRSWNVEPIRVCVSGFAVYGPTPVVIKHLERTCDSLVG